MYLATGKLSKHVYAPDLGPKVPILVHADLGPEHKYASIAYRSNPFPHQVSRKYCRTCSAASMSAMPGNWTYLLSSE